MTRRVRPAGADDRIIKGVHYRALADERIVRRPADLPVFLVPGRYRQTIQHEEALCGSWS